LTAKPNLDPSFTLLNGLIYYNDKLWVGNNTAMQQKLILQMHSSPVGGHSSILATIKRLQALFAWPGLKKHVYAFVKSYPTCQQAKSEWVKYPRLLQPL
jgi:hypothetical protein